MNKHTKALIKTAKLEKPTLEEWLDVGSHIPYASRETIIALHNLMLSREVKEVPYLDCPDKDLGDVR